MLPFIVFLGELTVRLTATNVAGLLTVLLLFVYFFVFLQFVLRRQHHAALRAFKLLLTRWLIRHSRLYLLSWFVKLS